MHSKVHRLSPRNSTPANLVRAPKELCSPSDSTLILSFEGRDPQTFRKAMMFYDFLPTENMACLPFFRHGMIAISARDL